MHANGIANLLLSSMDARRRRNTLSSSDFGPVEVSSSLPPRKKDTRSPVFRSPMLSR